MAGVEQDPGSHLFVLHCETLEVAKEPSLDLATLAKCQCHWYVGDAHHAKEIVGISHAGQSVRLDFCTFVVADVDPDIDVKLTVATVAGEHLAVFFGRLSELAQSEQFTRHELELRNVQGVVASVVVFCAEQQRWTVNGKGAFRHPGEAVTVGPDDMQASYVLQHIFPDEPAKDPKTEPGNGTGVVTERGSIDGKDSTPTAATQEADEAVKSRRPSREKVRRRSVLRESRRSQKSKAAEVLKEGFGLGQSDASTANSGPDALEAPSKAQSEATEDERSKEANDLSEKPPAGRSGEEVALAESLPPASAELSPTPSEARQETKDAKHLGSENVGETPVSPEDIQSKAVEEVSLAEAEESPEKSKDESRSSKTFLPVTDLGSKQDVEAGTASPALVCVLGPSEPTEADPPVASERQPSPSPLPVRAAVQPTKVEFAPRPRDVALLTMDSESEVSIADSDADLPLPSCHELAQDLGLGIVPATSSRPWQKAQPWRGRGPVVAAKGLWNRAKRAYVEDCVSPFRHASLTDDDSPRTFAGTHWLTGGRWEELLRKRELPLKGLPESKESKADPTTPGNGSEPRAHPAEEAAKVSPSGSCASPMPLGGWRVEQQGRWFRVSATALSIRRRPQVDAPLAGELPFGEVFQAVTTFTAEDGFSFLELSRGRGWVFSDARVQPVLVIDDTGAQIAATPDERRPRQAEAEAEPEPSCRFSPRISTAESPPEQARAATSVTQPTSKPQRGKVAATRVPRAARASSATETRRRLGARPRSAGPTPQQAQAASRALTEPSDATEPLPAEVPEGAAKPSNARDRYPSPGVPTPLETSNRPALEAWPQRGRQPVRAKHSLASQCAVGQSTSRASLFTSEIDRGLDADRALEPHRSSSVRSALESLEERQRMQAALLRVALRVNADDNEFGPGARSCSMPARSRIATSMFPTKRAVAEEVPAMAVHGGQRRCGATGAGKVSLSCQFLAAMRGQNAPLTPRRAQPQMEEALRAPVQRRCSSVPSRSGEAPGNEERAATAAPPYGFADILLASRAGT